jgi:hypothetical protein
MFIVFSVYRILDFKVQFNFSVGRTKYVKGPRSGDRWYKVYASITILERVR